MRPRKAERNAEMELLWDLGVSQTEIGKRYGISQASVHIILKRAGLTYKTGAVRAKPPEPVAVILGDTVRETAVLNRGRASAEQIAQACGVSRCAIIGQWFRARQSTLPQEQART